jgi:hypothetical protein
MKSEWTDGELLILWSFGNKWLQAAVGVGYPPSQRTSSTLQIVGVFLQCKLC